MLLCLYEDNIKRDDIFLNILASSHCLEELFLGWDLVLHFGFKRVILRGEVRGSHGSEKQNKNCVSFSDKCQKAAIML